MAARGNLNFRQRDVRAAVKAVGDAGQKVARVTIEKDGRVVIDVGCANIEGGGNGSPARKRHPAIEALER